MFRVSRQPPVVVLEVLEVLEELVEEEVDVDTDTDSLIEYTATSGNGLTGAFEVLVAAVTEIKKFAVVGFTVAWYTHDTMLLSASKALAVST